MRRGLGKFRLVLILLVWFVACQDLAAARVAPPVAVIGPQGMLVIAVRFPGTVPAFSLPEIKEKVGRVDRYLRAASYGKTWLEPKLVGWYDMPAPLIEYQVSPFNYKVDRARVRRLMADG